jgi:8-oxo-dGTP pyrophosphatase MutT (NUDIX family)
MQTSLSAEKEDRKTEAEAWKIYIESGMASADEGRQKVLGLEIDNARPVPRFILNPRTGPIPLESIFAISGPIDPETAAPSEDIPLADEQYVGAPGVLADKLPGDPAFKKAPVDPDDPNFPQNEKPRPETGVITPPVQATAPTAVAPAAVAPPATAVRKDVNKGLLAAGLVVRAADTGRVLMLQRSLEETDPASGTWEWPGGHIEGTESAWEAACREWQEETGCEIPDGEQLGSWQVGPYQGFLLEIPSEAALSINVQAGRVINPDDPDGDNIEVIAWFDPAHVKDMPALRPECKTTDWDLVCGLVPATKAETPGVTSVTGLVGYEMPDGDLDDGRSGDVELVDGVAEAFDEARDQAVQKELRRWRDLTRSRVKAGKRPRPFISDLIPPARRGAIEAALEGAATREEVDAAFSGRPKVRKAGSSRSFLSHIETAAGQYRSKLREALTFGLDALQVARQWTAKPRPVVKADDSAGGLDAIARAFTSDLAMDPAQLLAALEQLYTDGYLIGSKEGLTLLRGAGTTPTLSALAVKADAIDWSKWTPGNVGAARELAGIDGGRGLQTLLDEADVTIKSIQETRLAELTSTLAESASKGDSVDTLAGKIRDLLDDPTRADLIADTELNRAVTASTLDTYRQNGIEQFDVLVFQPCPVCNDEEANNPHELGDDAPPFHPGCRCAAAPHLSDLKE